MAWNDSAIVSKLGGVAGPSTTSMLMVVNAFKSIWFVPLVLAQLLEGDVLAAVVDPHCVRPASQTEVELVSTD